MDARQVIHLIQEGMDDDITDVKRQLLRTSDPDDHFRLQRYLWLLLHRAGQHEARDAVDAEVTEEMGRALEDAEQDTPYPDDTDVVSVHWNDGYSRYDADTVHSVDENVEVWFDLYGFHLGIRTPFRENITWTEFLTDARKTFAILKVYPMVANVQSSWMETGEELPHLQPALDELRHVGATGTDFDKIWGAALAQYFLDLIMEQVGGFISEDLETRASRSNVMGFKYDWDTKFTDKGAVLTLNVKQSWDHFDFEGNALVEINNDLSAYGSVWGRELPHKSDNLLVIAETIAEELWDGHNTDIEYYQNEDYVSGRAYELGNKIEDALADEGVEGSVDYDMDWDDKREQPTAMYHMDVPGGTLFIEPDDLAGTDPEKDTYDVAYPGGHKIEGIDWDDMIDLVAQATEGAVV